MNCATFTIDVEWTDVIDGDGDGDAGSGSIRVFCCVGKFETLGMKQNKEKRTVGKSIDYMTTLADTT